MVSDTTTTSTIPTGTATITTMITTALLPLFALLKSQALPTFSTLLSSLRMVCDNAPILCAKVATKFLLDLYALGEPFPAALGTMLGEFDAPMRECFVDFVKVVEGS